MVVNIIAHGLTWQACFSGLKDIRGADFRNILRNYSEHYLSHAYRLKSLHVRCAYMCTFIDVFLSFIGTNNIAFDLKEKGKFTPTYILRCGLPIQQSRPDTDPGRNHLVQILKVIQRPPIPKRLSACNSLSKVCRFDVQHHSENIIFGDEEGKLSSLLAVRVWDSY